MLLLLKAFQVPHSKLLWTLLLWHFLGLQLARLEVEARNALGDVCQLFGYVLLAFLISAATRD